MTKINYSQMEDADRPVVALSKIGDQPMDVFMCPADADIIMEDLQADEIIDACNGVTHPSMYKWVWYNETEHGAYNDIAQNLYIDLDDAAREEFDEDYAEDYEA